MKFHCPIKNTKINIKKSSPSPLVRRVGLFLLGERAFFSPEPSEWWENKQRSALDPAIDRERTMGCQVDRLRAAGETSQKEDLNWVGYFDELKKRVFCRKINSQSFCFVGRFWLCCKSSYANQLIEAHLCKTRRRQFLVDFKRRMGKWLWEFSGSSPLVAQGDT